MALFKKQPKEELPTQQKPTSIDEILAPSAVSVSSNYLQVGEKMARTLFVSVYPRYLNSNWFSPVINMDQELNIAFYVHPEDTVNILRKLRDKLARLQAQAIEEQEKGKVRDPVLETAILDIEGLRDKLQLGFDRFFRFGLYITILGKDQKELDEVEKRIRNNLESQLLAVKPATFRMKEGFEATLPLGKDELGITSALNTEPISSSFPFVSYDLTQDQGVLYGINTHNNSLILFDRFSLENANQVVFGTSGGGKSLEKSEPVLVKTTNGVEMKEIGFLIEEIIKNRGLTKIDDELEGVIDPNIEVWAFDKKLKGAWSKVTMAARKAAPKYFYKFMTKSGREVTTTGDHNMMVLRNGQIMTAKSSEVKKGEYLPLPRKIETTDKPDEFFNLLELLKDSKGIYVAGAEKLIKNHYETLKKSTIDKKFDQYLYKYKDGRIIPMKYLTKILDILGFSSSDPQLQSLNVVSRLNRNVLPINFRITEEFAKLLGYITAEGTITENTILISNTDSEVLKDIKSSLDILGISSYFGNRGIIIAERVFIETIKALGMKKKSGDKRVPSFIFNGDVGLINNYLKAYFEGDGGIESQKSVTAVSKSKELISEIVYLLYYSGIISRFRKVKKRAQNWTAPKEYWLLTISGQDNLKKFASEINFVSKRKQKLLSDSLNRGWNTNVDVIPEIQKIFQDIYNLFYFQLYDVKEVRALKDGTYNPSPEKLKEVVKKIRYKVERFKKLNDKIGSLNKLLKIDSIIDEGKSDKALNGSLWAALGHSWQLTKLKEVSPNSENVFKALELMGTDFNLSLPETKKTIYSGFQEMGLPFKYFDKSLQNALVYKSSGNTRYERLQKAADYVTEQYEKKIKCLEGVELLLKKLELLAESDLFWDPIEKIEKIENRKEKYVYDLTVDNEVFLAGSGGLFVHNSYAVKLEILRSILFGNQIIVIDPEHEYKHVAETLGGSFIKISIASENHLNPFDLPTPREDERPEDVFRSHVLDLTGLMKVMLGRLSPEEESILDEALIQTYAVKDIYPDQDFSGKEPPLMSDFQNVLEGMAGTESLNIRIKKYSEGTFAGFLNQPTNVSLDNQLVVFSIRDMEDELKPIAMYLVLNFVWTKVRKELRQRLLIVDEAWWLMKSDAGANFLLNTAKRARKYFLGLTTISQDVPDFINSPYGKPIVTNSALQLLMKQSPAGIETVKDTFNLTEAEKIALLGTRVGHGLFFAGTNHVAIRVVASYTEDQIITSDPRQILEIQEAKREWLKNNK